MPYFIERFWYIYEDPSNIKPIIERFLYLMRNRQKLVNTGIFRFKTGLILQN